MLLPLSTIAYPHLCTLSHPTSNLQGKVWRMQSVFVGEGASGPVYKETRGWLVDWQHLQPTSAHPTPPNTILFSHLYLSVGQWLRSQRFRWCCPLAPLLAQDLFILSPQRFSGSNPQRGATLDMLCQLFLYSQRLSSEALTVFNLQPIL